MAEAGILHEDDRVELIEGEILQMAPIGGRHVWCVIRLTELFKRLPSERAFVSVQNPLHLAPGSEPQPDITLLRPSADASPTALPRPADVLLLIEVADTSLGYDREVKVPLYAAAGIREIWIVDLQGDRLRVYREPDAGEYRRIEILARGAALAPQAFPELRLSVDAILG